MIPQMYCGSSNNLTSSQSQHYGSPQQIISGVTTTQTTSIHYGSSGNILTQQIGPSVETQQYGSMSNVNVSYAGSLAGQSDSVFTQGKSNIHHVVPASGPMLHQNETEILVKEIAMMNFNQMWNQTASNVKPGESLSTSSLVPHSSNFSGSVTSSSVGFSSLSAVCNNSSNNSGSAVITGKNFLPSAGIQQSQESNLTSKYLILS